MVKRQAVDKGKSVFLEAQGVNMSGRSSISRNANSTKRSVNNTRGVQETKQSQPWLCANYLPPFNMSQMYETSHRDQEKESRARQARHIRKTLTASKRQRHREEAAKRIVNSLQRVKNMTAAGQSNVPTKPPWLSDQYKTTSKSSQNYEYEWSQQKAMAKKARATRRNINASKRSRRPNNRALTQTKLNNWELLTCSFCHALVWRGEAVGNQSGTSNKLFSICCQQGRVQLEPIREPPSPLKELLETPTFRQNIRVANGMLAFTSTGGVVDRTVTGTPGPFTYRIHGQNHHQIGSLLPVDGKQPQYLQLYIFDTANERENRKKAFGGGINLKIDDTIVDQLIKMLDDHNHLAKIFRHARDRYESANTVEFNIRLIGQKHRGRQYDLPIADEIGGLIVGDFSLNNGGRDVVIEFKSASLQRISDLHPLFMSLQYPLLFPYGDYGYHERIPYRTTNESKIKRECMTMREYYAYQLQTRLTEGMTIIKGGRLLHQYIVDAYTATEQERLRFIRLNQKKLRADLYNNVCDAVERGDTDAQQVGNKVILPASFTAGTRYMAEKYHDAMAICRWYGNPNLFITVTANPNWEELKNHLEAYGGESPNSRPDLECRVFKLKLDEMMSDFKKGVFFPKPAAVVYTIEFQKRGLPHAHILLWFKDSNKGSTATMIDHYISAELPNKATDKEGFDLVERHMIHGPCGLHRPKSPCMEKGECTKNYPKPFSEHTTIDKAGFVVYRRREVESAFVYKNETKLDNRNVVPHNLNLLKKYKAHINVEWCCKTSAIKYLFKYITKGVDKATVKIEKSTKKGNARGKVKTQSEPINEIDDYLDCRYVSACEASWRLFAFHIHHNQPSVMKLTLHLPDQQRLVFSQTANLTQVLTREDIDRTMLTAWMDANAIYEEARELTYVEFPTMFVYHTDEKIWTPRKKQACIGRVIYVHPTAGALYYLRILINVLRGPTCWDDIYTVGGVKYKEFRDVCYAKGLLDDDKELLGCYLLQSWCIAKYQNRKIYGTMRGGICQKTSYA